MKIKASPPPPPPRALKLAGKWEGVGVWPNGTPPRGTDNFEVCIMVYCA